MGVKEASTFRVKVTFDTNNVEYFDSLVDLWSQWYKLYFTATYPRLMIRFEDMLLQAPAVLAKVAECVGTTTQNPIKYQQGSAKAHGSHTGFLQALLKSADGIKRKKGLTSGDLDYAAKRLDRDLMSAFQYHVIE